MNRPELPSVFDLENDEHLAAVEKWAYLDAQEAVTRNYETIQRAYEADLEEEDHAELNDLLNDAKNDFLRGQSISVPREYFRKCCEDYPWPPDARGWECADARNIFERIGDVYYNAFWETMVKALKRKVSRKQTHNPWRIPLLPEEERAERLPREMRAMDE